LNKYTVGTCIVCKRGVWGPRRGEGLRQISTYCKVHLQLNIFR
jgi:hypothetical protein